MSKHEDELCRAALNTSGVLAGRRCRQAARRLAATGTAESARSLAEVFLATSDDKVRGIAVRALRALVDPAAVDAVCDMAISAADERLRSLLAEAGHLPSDPGRRTLWLLLDGRFDEAADLDLDGGLLRAAHRTADIELRRRIAGKVRATGRVEWVRAVIGRADPWRLGEFTDDDWDSTLTVLTAARRWDELWRLAQSAPLPWAARCLQTLARHDQRREGDADLFALADRCTVPPSAAALFQEPRVLARTSWVGIEPALSERGDLLAGTYSAPDRRRGSLWRLPYGALVGEFRVRETAPGSLAISPDGSAVAISDYDGDVRVWSVANDDSFHLSTGHMLNKRHSCKNLVFTAGGELLVGAGHFGGVWVWHIPTKELIWSAKAHRTGRWRVSATPDGRLLAIGGHRDPIFGSWRAEVRLWRLPRGEPIGTIDADLSWANLTLTLTPDGRRLVVSHANGGQIVEVPSMERVATWIDQGVGVEHALSADGMWTAYARRDGHIEVRRTSDGDLVGRMSFDRRTANLRCLAFSRDRRLLAAVYEGGRLNVWYLPSGVAAGELQSADQRHTFGSAMFGADSALVAWPHKDREAKELLLWRSEPVIGGRKPVAEVALAEAERLRDRTRAGSDRPWGELIVALVRRRRRYDIELDAPEAPAGTDIDVSE